MCHDKTTAGAAKTTLGRRQALAPLKPDMFDTVQRDVFCHQDGRICKRRPVGSLADGAVAPDAAQQGPRNYQSGLSATAGAMHFIHHSIGLVMRDAFRRSIANQRNRGVP